jgi:hypothetical protein
MCYNSIREYVINYWNYITGDSAAAGEDLIVFMIVISVLTLSYLNSRE